MGKLANIFAFVLALMLSSCSDLINTSDNTDASNNSSSGSGGNPPPKYDSEPFLDFSCIDNKNSSVTCTAYLRGETATEYVWNTNDEIGIKGETVTLSLIAGKQTITLYADDGSGKFPYTVTKDMNVGATYTNKVFLYLKQESEPGYMYFAVKVKGNSSTGLFRQEMASGYAYVRDLHMDSPVAVATSGGTPTKYSNFNGAMTMEMCASYNVCVEGYKVETGFATEDGKSFEFPFYYGDDNFRVQMNGTNNLTFSFDSFVTRDTTIDGIFGGGFDYPAFAAVHGGKKLTITIPMSSFDTSKHKNIALFTINFKNYNIGTEYPEVIFDGFEQR